MVAIMIARGTLRVGSLASSESVETASNPRKDRHSTAAPAAMTPNPRAVPSPVNGAIRSTLPLPEILTSASTMNVDDEDRLHGDDDEVGASHRDDADDVEHRHDAMATRMNTQAGIAGNAASR